jgi:hypothetical protein
MRSRLFLSLLGAVALLATSAAQAGTLTSATWTQVTQGVPMTRTDVQLGITGNSTGSTFISASLSYPAFAIKKFNPKTPNGVLDLATSITQGGPQMVTAAPSGAGAATGVAGMVVVRTAIHNSAGANQSTFMTGINTLVKVPVSIGVQGTFTGNFIVLGIKHFITVDFFAWTPHTVVLGSGTATSTELTSKGVHLPTVSAMGSFNLTSNSGGTITLVSPTKISIDCGLAQRRTAGFTSLKMVFVPEPGTLLLLGAGALGLVLVGSRKR